MNQNSNLTVQMCQGKLAEEDLPSCFDFAAKILNYSILKQCLKGGIDPNTRIDGLTTALHLATERANTRIVELLIGYNVDLDLVNIEGLTSLNIASRWGFTDIVKLLLESKADVNKADKMSYSPLHHAVINDHVDIVKMLLQYGASPNAFNAFGFSPLFLAASERPNIHIIELLIQHNANINSYLPSYTMPLLMECSFKCRTREQLSVIEFLIRKGARINETHPLTKRSALHIAAYTGNTSLIEVLLNHGARTDLVDIRGNTPYDVAKEQKNKSAQYILSTRKIVGPKNKRSYVSN